MTTAYNKNDESKLLVAILDKYIRANGDQISTLSAYQFSSLYPELFTAVLGITIGDKQIIQNSDSRYWNDLKTKGFISNEGTQTAFHYHLTKLGYEEGHRRKSRVVYFLKDHWKYLFGSLLSFAAVVIAIFQYMKC